jgi:hypothetical protein
MTILERLFWTDVDSAYFAPIEPVSGRILANVASQDLAARERRTSNSRSQPFAWPGVRTSF